MEILLRQHAQHPPPPTTLLNRTLTTTTTALTHLDRLLHHPTHTLSQWRQFLFTLPHLYRNPPPPPPASISSHLPPSTYQKLLYTLKSQSYTTTCYLKLCLAGTIDPEYIEDPWRVFPHAEACVNVPWGLVVLVFVFAWIVGPLLWRVIWRVGFKVVGRRGGPVVVRGVKMVARQARLGIGEVEARLGGTGGGERWDDNRGEGGEVEGDGVSGAAEHGSTNGSAGDGNEDAKLKDERGAGVADASETTKPAPTPRRTGLRRRG